MTEIHGFRSPGEFARFQEWLGAAIRSGDFQEIPVGSRYGDIESFEERWFRDLSGVVWRLVAPEPPFMGVFAIVPPPER